MKSDKKVVSVDARQLVTGNVINIGDGDLWMLAGVLLVRTLVAMITGLGGALLAAVPYGAATVLQATGVRRMAALGRG